MRALQLLLVVLPLVLAACTSTSRYVISSPRMEGQGAGNADTEKRLPTVPHSFFTLSNDDLQLEIETNARLYIADSKGLGWEPFRTKVSEADGMSKDPTQIAIALWSLRSPASLGNISGNLSFENGDVIAPEKALRVDGPCTLSADEIAESAPAAGEILLLPTKRPDKFVYRARSMAQCILFRYAKPIDPRKLFSVQVGEVTNGEGIVAPLRIEFRPALFGERSH